MAGRPRVLYVEDDSVIAEMYRLGFDRAGFEVTIAPDSRAGLEALRSRPFDLVLLDVMLPGMDGIALLSEIRADPSIRLVPVAILSNAELGRRPHEKARRLGILGWMTKAKSPPPTVVTAVRRWLKAAELTRTPRGA